MRETRISLPELLLVAATRVMLGAGIGLLAASKFRRKPRTAVGATLLAIGVLSTIPLGIEVFGRDRRNRPDGEHRAVPMPPVQPMT